jgi:DNA-binding NarL/FixJ family response regulator
MATRILIADDHEMIRTVLRNLINSHRGWQVCAEAKNGSEAVAQAKQLRPDLIILDLAMPVMDGFRAAREIAKTDPGARMIMFTLHASPEVEEQAKRVGVRRVISKAKNSLRLVRAIEQTLGDGSGSEETCFEKDPLGDSAGYLKETHTGKVREIRVHQAAAGGDNGPTNGAPAQSGASRTATEASGTATNNSPDETTGAKNPSRDLPRKAT